MNVVGSGYHAPDFILVTLTKNGVVADKIDLIDRALSIRSKRTHFIFLGAGPLRRSLEQVNSKAYVGKVGIVCDTPIALMAFSGILPLDYTASADFHIEAFELHDEINRTVLKAGDRPVALERIDVVDQVVSKVDSFTSILSTLMTFVYTMPNSTHQKPVKELACSWLASTADQSELKQRINTLARQIVLTDKQKSRLYEILTSPAAAEYKRAMQSIKSDADVQAVAMQSKLSAYEIRYIMHINK